MDPDPEIAALEAEVARTHADYKAATAALDNALLARLPHKVGDVVLARRRVPGRSNEEWDEAILRSIKPGGYGVRVSFRNKSGAWSKVVQWVSQVKGTAA